MCENLFISSFPKSKYFIMMVQKGSGSCKINQMKISLFVSNTRDPRYLVSLFTLQVSNLSGKFPRITKLA